jgi:hypothetical protein
MCPRRQDAVARRAGRAAVNKAITVGVYIIDRMLSADIKRLIAAMLDTRPQERPTAKELRALRLFRESDRKSVV